MSSRIKTKKESDELKYHAENIISKNLSIVDFLIALAKRGCDYKLKKITSKQIAKELKCSQQTASRKLKELEELGFIIRNVSSKGQYVKISQKGIEYLFSLYKELEKIFCEHTHIYILNGIVTSGLGEGKYYMSLEGYRRQFVEKLGFDPYPGTLNLKLATGEDIKIYQMLKRMEGILIEGFKQEDRSFGAVKCFKAYIDNIEGAVIIPLRSHYIDVMEVISPKKLREVLKLKDGDIVAVKVVV